MSDVLGFSGFAELDKKLTQLPDKIARRALASAVRAGGSEIRKAARKNVPIRVPGASGRAEKRITKGKSGIRTPGFLRKNIVIQMAKRSKDFVHLVLGVTRHGYYGMFLEFGTKHQAARPWLRPAVESNIGKFYTAAGVKLWGKIEENRKLGK